MPDVIIFQQSCELEVLSSEPKKTSLRTDKQPQFHNFFLHGALCHWWQLHQNKKTLAPRV